MTDQCASEEALVRAVPRAALPPDEPFRLVTSPTLGALVVEGAPMTEELAQFLSDLEQRRRTISRSAEA